MQLTDYVQTPISSIQSRFNEVRYDPTLLIAAALDTVEEITNGEALLVDASSPAVMLLEMAAVQSANNIQESIGLMRRQYACLATTEDELYLHMSDDDYINRFAIPCEPVKISFSMQLNDFTREAVYDSTEASYKAVIARDTAIKVDGVVFSTLYPIVIRRYTNGVFQVSYDGNLNTPIYALKNTIIDYSVIQGTEQEKWIIFEVDAIQVEAATSYFTIDKTYNFKKDISFKDNFYYGRVFYKNTATGNLWVEMLTTHTDQVFDPATPTAIFAVGDQILTVRIPVVYTTNGSVSGEIRVDVYTTKGVLSMNLGNYRPDAYVVDMLAIDDVRDLDEYTTAMSNISFYVFSKSVIESGSLGTSFNAQKERVIYNAVGALNIPITNSQLEVSALDDGFTLVKNVDTLTNRIFLATKKLPVPSAGKLVTAANVGIVTYTTDMSELADHYKTIVNGQRVTIRSKALWESNNSILSILSKLKADALSLMSPITLVEEINSNQYFYTPFYYVLDASGEEFEIRPYALDQPYAKDLNFVRQNQSLQLLVNTNTYELKKTDAGFSLYILTRSGNYYKNMQDSEVAVQLAFYPYGEATHAYINGVLESKTGTGERLYRFDIETNHDMNSSDLICITNADVEGISDYHAWISLETSFKIVHSTNRPTTLYRADETDQLVGRFKLPVGFVGNTLEELTLHFGDSLKYLWKRSRSYTKDKQYRTYDIDIPLVYEQDVFQHDNTTGAIFSVVNGEIVYTYIHHAGDPVLDEQGNPVYKHRVGDVILDEQGNPIIDPISITGREFDILVIDAKYYYSNDKATGDYRTEIENTLTSLVTESVAKFQDKVLDQSKVFFYPKTTLGTVKVLAEDSISTYIDSEQSFVVDLYVKKNVYDNTSLRDSLKLWTIKTLDSYISKTTINMTELGTILRGVYSDSVSAFNVSGLGGDKNYQHLTLSVGNQNLCLKKRLVVQADRTMVVEAAVTVNFKKVS